MKQPTQNYLKSIFDYFNGALFWKIQKSSRAKIGSRVGWDHHTGYRMLKLDNKHQLEHRLIWIWHNGKIPKGYEIDHKNRIRNDNRIDNLRLVTRQGNMRNKSISKNNTSGIIGVHWHKLRKKWQAQITINKKIFYLGYFDNIKDAAIARKKAEKKYRFHENHGK